jgi:hypothetical protein
VDFGRVEVGFEAIITGQFAEKQRKKKGVEGWKQYSKGEARRV